MHKIIFILALLLLASCSKFSKFSKFSKSSKPEPVAVEEKPIVLNSGEQSLIETVPMLNPATQELFELAEVYELNGDFQTAINHLKRAYEIQPLSPIVTQKLAEIYLRLGDYKESFTWSRKAAMNGPSKGKMCEKSWNILAVSAELLLEYPTFEKAQQQALNCIEKAPNRY